MFTALCTRYYCYQLWSSYRLLGSLRCTAEPEGIRWRQGPTPSHSALGEHDLTREQLSSPRERGLNTCVDRGQRSRPLRRRCAERGSRVS